MFPVFRRTAVKKAKGKLCIIAAGEFAVNKFCINLQGLQ